MTMVGKQTLQGSDLQVSRLCLGTMTFGKPVELNEAHRMLASCAERGINFVDTANIYMEGKSEEILGEAIAGTRQNWILATKVFNRMGNGPEEGGLSRGAIVRALEASLRRLRTDYVDLYYLHQPDYSVPFDETLEAMEQLIRQGKVRFPATSNYASWQIVQMLNISERHRYAPVRVGQQMYNLLARGIEPEYLPMAQQFGVSTVVYNPLAAGLLTGKHSSGVVPSGGRFDNNKMYQDRYWHPQDFAAVERLKEIAQSAGRSLLSMSLNWLLHHTPIDCIVLGASRMEQLKQNLQAADEGPLPQDVVRRCDEVWKELRGPAPQYNR